MRNITKNGTYELYQHASVNNKTEFLKHLELKQNVVFAASINDQIEMSKLCTSAVLKTIPFNDGKLAHFQFTFKKLSDKILKEIFYSVINHSESSGKLPKDIYFKEMLQTTIDNKTIYINVWRIDMLLPIFQIEIY